jgi:hypothetical protein
VIGYRLQQLIEHGERDNHVRLTYLIHDLKYIGKPHVVSFVVSQTDFFTHMFAAIVQLHYADSVSQPSVM